MDSWFVSLLAIVSTTACIFLWFRDVRRIMRVRKNTVESAGRQLAAYREKVRKVRGDPETTAILERSEKIYRQAVDIYNQTLQKSWNYLPAHLMGYHRIPEKNLMDR